MHGVISFFHKKYEGKQMIIEDCRGLDCPAPVIRVKKALENAGGAAVRVIVDNGAPRENVLRFAATRRCNVIEEAVENGCQITILPESDVQLQQLPVTAGRQAVILVGSDRLGDGPDELGRLLMKNFIITLLELPSLPEAVFFINSGVLLTIEGSELIEPLHKLAAGGAEIFSCGVCLDYFGLRDKLAAGAVTNMYTIAERMLAAGNPLRV